MGAYLTKPETTTNPEQGGTERLKWGSSSMQGWRMSQEDAHFCLDSFDKDSELFAVFDGHGGAEVAKYVADSLPAILRKHDLYKEGQLEKALEEVFLKIDEILLGKQAQEKLAQIANVDFDDDEEEDEEAEVNELCEEATQPIEAVLAKYEAAAVDKATDESEKPVPLKNLRDRIQLELMAGSSKSNFKSPFLRAKTQPRTNGDESENDADKTEPEAEVKPGVDTVPETKNEITTQVSNGSVKNGVGETPPSDNGKSGEALNGDHGGDKIPEKAEIEAESPAKNDKGKRPMGTPKTTVEKKDIEDTPIYKAFVKDMEDEELGEEEAANLDSEDSSFSGEEGSEENDDDEENEAPDEEDESSESSGDETNPYEALSFASSGKPGFDSGCTAVVALLQGTKLFVANAGDSRCVVSRKGTAIEMSLDHKPEDDIERDRITKAGGEITEDGRVNGGLNLSRAIGDHTYKQNKTLPLRDQMISSQPDIKTLTLHPPEDEFMVLACDGIWNSMTSQQVVDFVRASLKEGDSPSAICDKLFYECLAPSTDGDGTGCDNMTCIIVTFAEKMNESSNLDKNEPTPLHAKRDLSVGDEPQDAYLAPKRARMDEDELSKSNPETKPVCQSEEPIVAVQSVPAETPAS